MPQLFLTKLQSLFKAGRAVAACLLVALLIILLNTESSFALRDEPRASHWSVHDRKCVMNDDLQFSPMLALNPDLDWEIPIGAMGSANPYCMAYIASVGTVLATAQTAASIMCGPTGALAQNAAKQFGAATTKAAVKQALQAFAQIAKNVVKTFVTKAATSGVSMGTMGPISMIDTGLNVAQWGECAFRQIGCGTTAGANALDCTIAGTCCGGAAIVSGAIAASLIAVAIIYGEANNVYKNAQVCGSEWQVWAEFDGSGKELAEDKLTDTGTWKRGSYGTTIGSVGNNSYSKCINSLFAPQLGTQGNVCALPGDNYNETSNKNKYYREFIYGGMEFEDIGDGACSNPSSWSDSTKINILGYASGPQRYYMRGPDAQSNYACTRFLLGGRSPEATEAYNCCIRRSQTTICVQSPSLDLVQSGTVGGLAHGFCTVGQKCKINGYEFEATNQVTSSGRSYTCAQTFSVCPYNHMLGGGTELAKLKDNASQNGTEKENYCQYLKHCVMAPPRPQVNAIGNPGSFISQACYNMVGDSQNVYFNNITFYNPNVGALGPAIDLLPVESIRGFSAPLAQCFKESMENVLFGNTAATVTGTGMYNGTPFFVTLQNNLRTVIKLAMSFAVMGFGFSVLVGGAAIDKKKVLNFIIKLSLVMFFALGNAWQMGFVNGIIGGSTFLESLVTRIKVNPAAEKQDGCQFPKFNYTDPNFNTRYNSPKYPPGKEYLEVWDTLDCKLARAIGYGPEVSVPSIIGLMLAGLFTGPIGIAYFVASLVFAFYMLAIIVRALHIFLMSITAVILLIYVSPLTITLSLFERTKGIFDGWWKQVLGLALQPMILFAYLGILVTVFDNQLIGSARFIGDGKAVAKRVDCSPYIENGVTKDPGQDSVYCLFASTKIKNMDNAMTAPLAVIGIAIPVLDTTGVSSCISSSATSCAGVVSSCASAVSCASGLSDPSCSGALNNCIMNHNCTDVNTKCTSASCTSSINTCTTAVSGCVNAGNNCNSGLANGATMLKNKLMLLFQTGLLLFVLTTFLDEITRLASTLVGGAELKGEWGGGGGFAEMMSGTYGVARGVQQRGSRVMKRAAVGGVTRGVGAAKSALGKIGRGSGGAATSAGIGGSSAPGVAARSAKPSSGSAAPNLGGAGGAAAAASKKTPPEV